MQTVHESTTQHVRRAVCHHDFIDSVDWATGLDELATFTDDEIDALTQDEPSDLIIFEEAEPVTPEQTAKDRELFDRYKRLLRAAGLACVLTLSASAASAMEISGPATVIDGDTLVVASRHVRIWGIDALEHDQRCGRSDGDRWACGEFSRDALVRTVRNKRVTCQSDSQDRYGRDVARCSVGTVDLGAEQVRDGWALDWQHYSHGAYAGQEAEARASLNGIWSGTFENPWDCRHAHSGQEAAR